MALDLQAAINAAPAGGTLTLQAGQTYGPGKLAKKLTIIGNGAIIEGTGNVLEFQPGSNGSVGRNFTAQGSTVVNGACVLVRAPDITLEDVIAQDSKQYGIRAYQTDRLTLRRVTVKRAATGIQVHRNGIDNLFEDIRCEQLDRMRVDDGGLGTNGAQGLDFYYTTGTTRINRLTVIGARAKTYGGVSWPYDGSAVEGYGACGPVIIDTFDFRDCVNICEVGTTGGAGVPTGWVFRNGKAEGNPDAAPGWDKNCEGFFLRANNGFVIENNTFVNIDDFILNLVSGGSYGGPMGGNTFRNNTITLKSGPSTTYGLNRAYIIASGVTPTAWGDVSGNKVNFDSAKNPEVGFKHGSGGTRVVTQFKTWTGWTLTNETWGAPIDPALSACQSELASAKAEVTSLKAEVAKVTSERDAALAANAMANAEVARLTSVVAQVHALTKP